MYRTDVRRPVLYFLRNDFDHRINYYPYRIGSERAVHPSSYLFFSKNQKCSAPNKNDARRREQRQTALHRNHTKIQNTVQH